MAKRFTRLNGESMQAFQARIAAIQMSESHARCRVGFCKPQQAQDYSRATARRSNRRI